MTNVIQQNDTVKNNIFKMANKDREVIDILLNVLEDVKNEDFIDFLIKLDKKRVYGTQIWKGYTIICEEDSKEFYNQVMDENEFLFDYMRK